jgi:hypothetical protein
VAGALPSATNAIGYKIYFHQRLFHLTEPAGGMRPLDRCEQRRWS